MGESRRNRIVPPGEIGKDDQSVVRHYHASKSLVGWAFLEIAMLCTTGKTEEYVDARKVIN